MRATYLGEGTLLFHDTPTGAYTVHKVQRDFLDQTNECLFDPPFASGTWDAPGTHHLTWMGGSLVLDYEPTRGHYTFHQLNRAAQNDEDPLAKVVTRGSFMSTARSYVHLRTPGRLSTDSSLD